MISQHDLRWGARSGIQKAIRREDIGLARFCFDLLWEEENHRQWLLPNRIAAIVAEDCWRFGGELAQALANEPTDDKLLYKHWQLFVLRLAAFPSNKEAAGLAQLAMHTTYTEDTKRWACMRALLSKVKERQNKPERLSLEKDILPICTEIYPNRRLTEYEQQTIKAFANRVRPKNWNGFYSDKICCLAAIVLVFDEGLDRERVKMELNETLKTKKIQRYTTLPYYCFDQHTLFGKWAIASVLKTVDKQDNMDEERLRKLIFYYSSACINRPSPLWEKAAEADILISFKDLDTAQSLWRKYHPRFEFAFRCIIEQEASRRR